jgi:hypothetical protein
MSDKRTYYDGKANGYSIGFEEGRKSGCFWTLVTLLVFSLAVCLTVQGFSIIRTSKTITIDSKIVSIDYDSVKTFYTVHFADGSTYNINKDTTFDKTEKIIDFDSAENVIVELNYNSGWLSPNVDNCWGLSKIIKY